MSRLTSVRERRLWIGALLAVAAIWATLPLAGLLAEALRGQAMLGVAFFAGFVVTMAAIAWGALRRRPRGRETWALIGITAVYGMVVVRMGVSLEERSHLFEYGLVAVLLLGALDERRANGRTVPLPALLAIAATALLGWIDEAIQAVLPARVYDLRDVGFNALAAVMAVTAARVLWWARERRAGRRA